MLDTLQVMRLHALARLWFGDLQFKSEYQLALWCGANAGQWPLGAK